MYNREQDINDVLSRYRLLKYDSLKNRLWGEIELISENNGRYIDIFSVEILISDCFPKCFPKVIEMEEKIPRSVSRHIMPQTNYLCLSVEVEEILLCKQGSQLQIC